MDDRVDALQINADHVVPLLFGHFFDGRVFEVPDAGVGDKDVQAAEARDGVLDEFLIVGMPADVGLECLHARAVLAGFLFDQLSGVLGFVVVEDHIRAGLRKQFDGRRPDAARASGDECRLACQ